MDFRTDMDSYYRPEGRSRRRTRLRHMCSLCNEPSLPAEEQIRHFTSAVHKHMKKIKQKQYSYTKNLKTFDEKIKASAELNEPLIGLEYIYKHAADRRGVVPYVCVLCDCVYKIDTIFFHIVSTRHRSLYLSKNFPALGIKRELRLKTPSDYRKLLNAAAIVEKNHGKREINVLNTSFHPNKNGSIKCDVESEGEGLSPSEDEDTDYNPHHTEEGAMFEGRSLPYRGDHQYRGGPPLLDEHIGGPGRYDRRPDLDIHEGRGAMIRPLRDDSGYGYGGHRGLSHPDGRNSPGMLDFQDDLDLRSRMPRDGAEYEFSDRQGGPRRNNHPGRASDSQPRGDHRTSEGPDYEEVQGLNRRDPRHPDHPMRTTDGSQGMEPSQRRPYMTDRYPPDGAASRYDRRGSSLPSDPRDVSDPNERGFAYPRDQRTPLLDHVDSDIHLPYAMTQSRPRGDFSGLQSQIPRHTDKQKRKTRWGSPHGDPDMPPPGRENDERRVAMMHEDPRYADGQYQRDRSQPLLPDGHQMLHPRDKKGQNHPSGFSEDPQHRNRMNLAYDDREDPSLMPPRGVAYPYDDLQQEMPQDGHQRPQLPPNVPTMSSTYQQGDRHAYDERRGTRGPYPGDPKYPREMRRHKRDVADYSGAGHQYGSVDDQDGTNDSDMEVRSMELSDSEPDAFSCNAELFEFLKTFQVLSFEDQQFALRVREIFTYSAMRYKNHKEEMLKRRIAEEKERLEEEKKAFLAVQRARERPKKDRPKPSAAASSKIPAPGPTSRTKPPIPTGRAPKPAPLMSLTIGPTCPPERRSRWGPQTHEEHEDPTQDL